MKILNEFKLKLCLPIFLLILGGFANVAHATPLDSWSFYDSTNWTSDSGYTPVSFTNLNYSYLGNGSSLVVDTNVPAWLQYNVFESDGTTNLTVDSGTITFWFAPNWSSVGDTNGGFGPGEYGRLLDVGNYTDDSSYGWWSLYVDDGGTNLYFSAQTNDLSATFTTYLSTPIDWTTNYFHFVALTYSPTETALYLDGVLVTNGPGVTVYPGLDVLTNGFVIGSDNAGNFQSHGLFNTVQTYNYELSGDDILNVFDWSQIFYFFNPQNTRMLHTGTVGLTSNLLLQFSGYGGGNASLAIQVPLNTSGTNYMFDVYATTNLLPNVPGLNGTNWIYVARAAPGQVNVIVPTLPNAPICFYRLGTMLDSDGDGLPDAYENLVSHTDPNSADSNGNGIADGDEISPSGLPWRLELARKWGAIIYANTPTATQGGASGQCTVYLPTPAPSGGATVQYYLGGSAALNADYTISPTAGQLTIPAGNSSGFINVSAVGTGTYSPINLYADLTLTNATGYRVDSTPAEVNIVDTGTPSVRVFALPPWVRRPNSTFGTNVAGFYFIRGGPSTNALTLGLASPTGTATSGADYSALPASITFPANVRTNWLPLTIFPNSINPTNKWLTLSINSATGYTIDPTNGSATVTIAATALPALPVVQVTATDVDATTNSPAQFTFTRSFATTNALRVYFHVWGSTNNVYFSTNGQDSSFYSALSDYVDIPANVTNATLSVNVSHPDSIVQTLTLTLAAGDYSIGNNNSDTIYIDGGGTPSANAFVIRDGIYGASVSQAAEIKLVRYGSALSSATINWNITNTFTGPSIQGTHSGTFTWPAHQSVITVQISTSWSSYLDEWRLPELYLTNSWGLFHTTVPYNPPSALFSMYGSGSPATTVTRGTTLPNAITFNRPHPNANPITLGLTISGTAVNGTDFSMGSSVAFAANQTSASLSFQALSSALAQGWKTVIVSINSGNFSSQVGLINGDKTFVRIQDTLNTTSDTDMDGDGLPDGFELSNLASGFDPLTPNNPFTDSDRDGIGLTEELQLGSDPNSADSPPTYPSLDENDYVSLVMRVGAIGKMLVPNQQCSLCHSVTVRVGNYIRSSSFTDWSHNPTVTDNLIRFVRGTNYQVQVTCNPYYSSLLTSNQAAATGSPHYTAAYIAQFLSATNGGVWPFVGDTNHLIGANLSMVQEVLPKRAMIFIPDMTIAADVDRSGTITFTNRADRTEPTNPFTFWINDDCDTNSDDTASDLDPSVTTPDSANNSISNLRDLEDFTRLQFKIDGLPQQFLTNGYQVKVYLTNLTGNASLRLFPSTDTSGSLSYLTNTTAGTAQLAASMIGVVSNGTPATVASNLWIAAGNNSWFLPMIFEGISTGSCVVVFGFSTNNQPPVAVSRPFYLNLQKITSLYEHWTVGDNTNTDWTQIPNHAVRTSDSGIYSSPQNMADMDYVLFVHGWRMAPWERRAFASTAYKRMWQLGYKGRFALYSWPTDYTGTGFWDMLNPITGTINRQNYDRSEQRAWVSGFGLLNLLAYLNADKPPEKVRLIAHSMGNIVASEALRLRGMAGMRTPLVQSYIASQAASVANAYDSVNPEIVRSGFAVLPLTTIPEVYANYLRHGVANVYFAGMTNAVLNGNINNFNNFQDYALNSTFAWPGNQASKPDLGWWYDTTMFWQHLPFTFLDPFRNDAEAHEVFAHIAIARSKALGSADDPSHHIQNQVKSVVYLNLAPFNFGNNDYEHSAEFNSINMKRRTYWWQVLSTFGLTNGIPNL